jgi:arylsulfatase A-like enzyme
MTIPPREVSTDPDDGEGPRRACPGVRASFGRAASVLATAAWFGASAGLLELAILLTWHRFHDQALLGMLQLNRHFLWMIPAAHLAVFLACGLPPALSAGLLSHPGPRVTLASFAGLALFAILKMIPGLYTAAAAVLAAGVAIWARSRLRWRALPLQRLIARSLPLPLGAVLVLGAWTYNREVLAERRSLAGLPEARPGAPNVLLIVLDTVRADKLSLYGYPRETSPRLAALAHRGVVFDQARAAAPWTLPSHASLFTGRWPHELGVGGNRPLDGTYPTLAEFLARHGYAAAGFVGNTYFCNSWYGLARGFAHYEDYYEQNVLISPGEAFRCAAIGRWLIRLAGTAYNVRPDTASTHKDAERVNRDFLRWLGARRARGRPFFAFLNYIDAHDPYLTPPGFDRHFGIRPETPADFDLIRNLGHRRKHSLKGRDLALIRDAYDDCLAYLDEQIGRLFDALERDGVLGRTLVVVTADHGEQIGERGFFGHGMSLYSHEIRVPLLILGPSGVPAGRRVAGAVSLRDVAATVAERLGLAGASPLPGRSLARSWEPTPAPPAGRDGPILSEVRIWEKSRPTPDPKVPPSLLGPMASLACEGKVYIRDAFDREELYDLASDPDEVHNLAASPEFGTLLGRFRRALDRVTGRPPGPAQRTPKVR